ncbi:MAG TPA: hypothetical protein DEA08_30480, partial [Planctomycetes bacterium]|nr:hypothetical protein [Planctomycetota bacterium]
MEEQLGRGGMGDVYRARHVQLGHEVALKLILDLEDAEPDLLERFHIEGQALARLRHEHLVAVLDAGRDARGRPWLAMELVEGEDLAERLKREGPLPPAEAALLVADLAEALAHAHERGVLHRDVKPSNVLLRASDGSALLTDFGLAKRLDRSGRLTQTGEVLGSPGFLAPEQCGSGEPNGPATDVYGLGALLFALLVGRPPCHGKGLIHTLHLVLEVPPTLPAEVPAELARICARCLEKAAAARYSSAAELATELRDWSAALAQTTPRPQRAPLAALALVVALLLGAWLGLRADPGAVPGRATWSPPASPTPPASANPQPSASPAPAPESAARRECLVAWKEGDAATLIQALERLPLPERAPLLYELSLDERSLSGPQLAAARLLEAPALLDASGQAALALLRATCALEEQRRRGTAQSMIASVEGVFEALEQPLPVARDLRLRVLFATRFPITQRVPREIVERLAGSALRRAREEPCPASLAALGLVFSLELDRAAAPFLTHALSSPWAEELAPLLREHLQKRCALALLIAGQPREALRVAQTIRTKGAGPELLIATCYEEAGDLAACRRILEGCTSEARARERLGWLVLQLGDLDALERLVAEAPQQRDWTSAALRACLRL